MLIFASLDFSLSRDFGVPFFAACTVCTWCTWGLFRRPHTYPDKSWPYKSCWKMVEKCGKLKLWQNITKVVDPDKPSAARLHVSWKKYKKYPDILEPNVPVLADFCCMQPNQIMLAKMVGPAKNILHQLGSNVQVNRFGKIAINSRYLQPRQCTVYWTHIAPWIAWQVAVSLRSRPSSSTSPLDAFRHLCERTEQTWCVCLPKGGASGWTHAEMCCNAHGKYPAYTWSAKHEDHEA